MSTKGMVGHSSLDNNAVVSLPYLEWQCLLAGTGVLWLFILCTFPVVLDEGVEL